MVLHQSNFEIPVRFSFQPYVAEWRMVCAETVEWVINPIRLMSAFRADDNQEKNWIQVRIEIPDFNNPGMLFGFGFGSCKACTAVLDRASIPADILQSHENHINTPDISGRSFRVLICQKPEFKEMFWALKPGEVTKNAWIMRDEFLSLDEDPDPELGWDWSVRQFLNKWGLWGFGQVSVDDWELPSPPEIATFLGSVIGERANKIEKPGVLMVIPHLLKEQQEKYRKALLPRNARPWLRSHPLSLDTADVFPFYCVRKSYCSDAIDTTITIDHLAERQFGICKRCHNVFQKETRHEKNYCSERCFNAAGVQRWREKQRKVAKKGAKQNAKRKS